MNISRIFAYATLLPCIVVTVWAQREQAPLSQVQTQQPVSHITNVTFDGYVWDFGTIREVDGDVSHTFTFTNRGSVPFVIQSVNVSCGCTTPVFSKEPTLPGKGGTITVTYDPANRPGPFEKTITIYSNEQRRIITLTVRGNVTPRPRTIQDDYPFHISDGLRAEWKQIPFGLVPRGHMVLKTLGIANSSQKSIRIGLATNQLPACVTARAAAEVLAPGERSEIVVTIDARQVGLWGRQTYRFVPIINGHLWDEPITVTAIFTEDFSLRSEAEQRNAPVAEYSTLFYHFSDQEAGTQLRYEVKVTNRGLGPLEIRSLQPSSSRIKAQPERRSIASGDTVKLTVTVDTRGLLPGTQLSEAVGIVTNDPEKPFRELRILANIK